MPRVETHKVTVVLEFTVSGLYGDHAASVRLVEERAALAVDSSRRTAVAGAVRDARVVYVRSESA